MQVHNGVLKPKIKPKGIIERQKERKTLVHVRLNVPYSSPVIVLLNIPFRELIATVNAVLVIKYQLKRINYCYLDVFFNVIITQGFFVCRYKAAYLSQRDIN